MEIELEDYSKVHQLSVTDAAYIAEDPRLQPFIAYPSNLQGLLSAAEKRKEFPVDRQLLYKVLKQQYTDAQIDLPEGSDQILQDNTFIISTAHQPSLFTGPLYHIYKIASVIHLTAKLNQEQTGFRFLPFFIVSGEDHDWEEINHFYLFGKKHQWERPAGGPCGRFSLEGLEEIIDGIKEILKNTPYGNHIDELLQSCLTSSKSYGQFHTKLIHSLFGQYGLILLNPDDAQLKKSFSTVIRKEITEKFSFATVPATQRELEKSGFKPQAYCRPVNLFYMTDDRRERIDWQHDHFVLAETGKQFSEEEILAELNVHPERFSPNVILRPLFQEFILPGVAYVGGGGEIAYWLERKAQFDALQVHYPVLIRRSSVLMIDESMSQQLNKLGFAFSDLLKGAHAMVREYLIRASEGGLQTEEEKQLIQQAFMSLAEKAKKVDPTLSTAIHAEETKLLKQFEQLSSRLLRTQKHQEETQVKKIERVADRLFPGGGLQERQENFLNFYAQHGPRWIKEVIDICDPLDKRFILASPAQ